MPAEEDMQPPGTPVQSHLQGMGRDLQVPESPSTPTITGGTKKKFEKESKVRNTRKHGDASFLPVARARVVESTQGRTFFEKGLIDQGAEGVSAASKRQKTESHNAARRIGRCKINQPESSSSLTGFDANVFQMGQCGPAAYLPSEISIDRFEEHAVFNSVVRPQLRPMLFFTSAEDEGAGLASLSHHLKETNSMALINVRSVEILCCYPNATSTHRRKIEEWLVLMAEGPVVDQETNGNKVIPEPHLIGIWVKPPDSRKT